MEEKENFLKRAATAVRDFVLKQAANGAFKLAIACMTIAYAPEIEKLRVLLVEAANSLKRWVSTVGFF